MNLLAIRERIELIEDLGRIEDNAFPDVGLTPQLQRPWPVADVRR
jgi:hypothetical protein